MLGRFAAAGRMAAARQPMAMVQKRTFAGYGYVSSPRPLSIRMDGLFAQCMIAAVIYFAPQDILVLTGLVYKAHTDASNTNPKKKAADAEAALEEFKAKKGLSDVKVSKGYSTWTVSL
mmetsp:Transcript_9805/g.21369  ORF Transcript_9805/g.21369 Transcript_9805/m.21369 type:complete len:118 (-) Transcript_9805:171-524(-)